MNENTDLPEILGEVNIRLPADTASEGEDTQPEAEKQKAPVGTVAVEVS